MVIYVGTNVKYFRNWREKYTSRAAMLSCTMFTWRTAAVIDNNTSTKQGSL